MVAVAIVVEGTTEKDTESFADDALAEMRIAAAGTVLPTPDEMKTFGSSSSTPADPEGQLSDR